MSQRRLETAARSLEGSLLNGGVFAIDLGANIFAVVSVQLHELDEVKLGLLEHLDLAHVAVLDGEDASARLLDLLADHLGDELVNEFPHVALAGLGGDDVYHLLPDLPDLASLGVARLLDLVLSLFGESDAKDAHNVAIGRLDVDTGFDERLPLFDERAELVAGKVHAVKVGKDLASLDILANEPHLAVSVILVLVKIGERDFEHASLELLGSDLGALGPGAKRKADIAVREHRRSAHGVPVLLEEGVDLLLLALALLEVLVLANSHGVVFLFCSARLR